MCCEDEEEEEETEGEEEKEEGGHGEDYESVASICFSICSLITFVASTARGIRNLLGENV